MGTDMPALSADSALARIALDIRRILNDNILQDKFVVLLAEYMHFFVGGHVMRGRIL